jgi:pyrroloquinoline quinone (PQQ) biosynthesis protein C
MAAELEWMSWVGKLPDPVPAIREFAVQYHYFSVHQIVAFSRALSSLAPMKKRALSRVASVIVDELGPADRDEAHSTMFERFAISVGVPSAELPAPGGRVHRNVRAYVKALEAAFSSGSAANVLGAYLFLEASAVQGYVRLTTI